MQTVVSPTGDIRRTARYLPARGSLPSLLLLGSSDVGAEGRLLGSLAADEPKEGPSLGSPPVGREVPSGGVLLGIELDLLQCIETFRVLKFKIDKKKEGRKDELQSRQTDEIRFSKTKTSMGCMLKLTVKVFTWLFSYPSHNLQCVSLKGAPPPPPFLVWVSLMCLLECLIYFDLMEKL